MNIYKRSPKALFCLMLVAFTSTSNAEQCGAIASQATLIDDNEYILELIRDNGKVLTQKKNYTVSDRNFTYLLAPGWHTLTALKWSKRDYSRLKESRRRIRLKQRTDSALVKNKNNTDWTKHDEIIPNVFKQFKVLVEDGRKITVGLENHENGAIKIFSTDDYICENIELPLAASDTESQVVNQDNITLPRGLEYRLRIIMTKLAKYHADNSLPAENIIPVHVATDFGIIIDNEYDITNQAIKVLAVTPGSVANNVGLYSGDRIISIGKTEINVKNGSPHQQFREYISRRSYDEKLKFTVIRGGKELDLSSVLKLQLNPEINYSFHDGETSKSFVKNVDMVTDDKHQLLAITKEIQNYFQTNSYEGNTIKLSREPATDYIYGLSAKVMQAKKGHNVLVDYVVNGSSADRLGLKANDEIIAFNNIPMTANGLTLLGALITNLKFNENYTMLINRNGKEIELSKPYQPETLIGFNYAIDNYKVMKLNDQIAKYKKIRQFEIFEDSVLARSRFQSSQRGVMTGSSGEDPRWHTSRHGQMSSNQNSQSAASSRNSRSSSSGGSSSSSRGSGGGTKGSN